MDATPWKTRADASFTQNQFVIQIPEGTTKNLQIRQSQVRFEDLQTANPKGTVDLHIQGPLEEALWVADHPPLQFASQYGLKPSDVSGKSDTHLMLKFSTKTPPSTKTIRTTVDAKLQNFALTRVILNHPPFYRGGFELGIPLRLYPLRENSKSMRRPPPAVDRKSFTQSQILATL